MITSFLYRFVHINIKSYLPDRTRDVKSTRAHTTSAGIQIEPSSKGGSKKSERRKKGGIRQAKILSVEEKQRKNGGS